MLNNYDKIKRPILKIPSVLFTLFLSIYFIVFFNIPIVMRLINIIHPIILGKIGFMLSIPILLLSVFNIFFIVWSIKYFEKVFYIIMVLISSIISYAMYNYGVIFDTNMVVNILCTNYHEAASYLNTYSVVWFILSGVLPSIIIGKINITHPTFSRDIVEKVISVLLSLLIIVTIAGLYYKDYSFIKRSNDDLNKMIVPFFAYISQVFYQIYI